MILIFFFYYLYLNQLACLFVEFRQKLITPYSDSFGAELYFPMLQDRYCGPTSISSLLGSSGASMMLRRLKESESMSNLWPVTLVMRSQWRSFMALSAMSSRSGQVSLKSSMVCFSSRKACHSFRPLGSLRHLHRAKDWQIISIETH